MNSRLVIPRVFAAGSDIATTSMSMKECRQSIATRQAILKANHYVHPFNLHNT